MARLCAYYSLCPLIDQKSLLGIAEDSASGCVIVTLGKNIVIRYKVRFVIVIYFKLRKWKKDADLLEQNLPETDRRQPNISWTFLHETKRKIKGMHGGSYFGHLLW
jgi:hypothetical protein